jgi:hypothetical protein
MNRVKVVMVLVVLALAAALPLVVYADYALSGV